MVIKNGRVYLPGQGFTDCDLGFGETSKKHEEETDED